LSNNQAGTGLGATPYKYESEIHNSYMKIATPKTNMNSKDEGDAASSNRYDLNVSIKSITDEQRVKTAEEYKTTTTTYKKANPDQKV